MNKLSRVLRSVKDEQLALSLLEGKDKVELREIASDLGIYCQTRLMNHEIIDRILCNVLGANRRQFICGAKTPSQDMIIARVRGDFKQNNARS